MSRPRAAGMSTIELLVGAALGLSVLGLLLSAGGVGVRLLTHTSARGEVHDIADLTADAFRFDLRRTGFAPDAPVTDALALARANRVTVRADLDGNGNIDPSSEEVVSIACLTGPARVSRIVGSQSLPLANEVIACGLRYFGASGTELIPPVGGLSPADRQRVVAVELRFTLGSPWLRYRASRQILASRRGTS